MSATSGNQNRLAFLDQAKGMLVLLMVVYHCLNYTSQYHLAFRYLSFLPPSFILISGFLIAIAYYPRYLAGPTGIWARLLTRGAKLLLLFIALNIVAQYVRSPVYGQSQSVGVSRFFEQWHDVFVLGTSRAASFEVLVPIGYLLVLGPGLIWLAHCHRVLIPVLTILVVGSCTWLSLRGATIANLTFLSVGVVGIMAGLLLPRPELIGRPLLIAAIAYAAYFPLSLIRGYVYLVQLAGAIIALVLICSISLRVGATGWWRERLIRIGQYSLLSYILQIGILQILSRFLGRPDPLSLESAFLFSFTVLSMVVAVEFTVWLRQRSRISDRLYVLVFA